MEKKTKKIYVTYQFKYNFYKGCYEYTEHIAVACDTMEQAREVAAEVNSYDGVRYIKINKCGRIKDNFTILPYGHPSYRLDGEDSAYEVCPHCGKEVEIKAEMKAQRCPNCGMLIAPCSLCPVNDCDCANCKIRKQVIW